MSKIIPLEMNIIISPFEKGGLRGILWKVIY